MLQVKFTPESDSLTLDQQGNCELIISNKGKAVIYKVKSNMGERVQVNHVYGIVGGKYEKVKILIRYIGVRESVEDVRVRVCWVEAESVPVEEQPCHQDLSNLYLNSRNKNEEKARNIVLKVVESTKKNSIIDKFNIAESQQLRFSSKISQKQKNRIMEVCESISKMRQAKEQLNKLKAQQQQRQVKQSNSISLSVRQTIVLVIFIFLLGVSFGIKIQHLTRSTKLIPLNGTRPCPPSNNIN